MRRSGSERPHITYLHASNDWYGSDKVAYQAVRALTSSADVEVILADDSSTSAPRPLSEHLGDLGVEAAFGPLPVLRRASLSPAGLLPLLRRLIDFWRRTRGVRGQLFYVNTAALALCLPVLRLRGAYVVAHLHETLEGRERVVLGRLVGAAHRIITVSEVARARLPHRLRARASVVPNCVSDAAITRLPDGPALRVLFAGRWTPRKGLGELVDVWKSLDPSRFHLTVLGGFPASGQRAVFAPDEADALPHVSVVGEVADVTPWIDRAHVVIIPSLLPEGLPLVALEALARGRPVVATRAGGLREVVTDETGWFLPDDPRGWRDVLDGIAPDQVAGMQQSCHTACLTTFSERAFGQRVTELVSLP